MPNVTISELRQAGPITGAELVPIVQNGVTVQTTTGALAGAPLQSQTFLTLNQESTLPNSRYLSVGTGLGLTDGGAQSTYQLALTGAGLSLLTSPTGLQVKTGPNTVGAVQIAVGNGLSITNASGATGNPTISLATGIMSNLAATTGTGFLAVNGATVTPVSLQPVANQTVVYDPSAVAGVPAVGLADNPVVPGTASITVPTGTTAQRAATPTTAMFRFNTTTGFFEGYDGAVWRPFAVGGAAVTSFSAGTTGLTPNTASTGVVTLGGVLNAASGGTGAASLTGYLYGNGTGAATASATIPTTALSGQITNAQLVNPSLTINGSLVNLGGATTVTAATPNALTAGTGLSGGSFTGAAAATFALANTTVTAGSYGNAANTTPFTVDAQGRLTAAASTPIAILSQQITDKGAANGVASLDATGVVPLAQLPASIAGAVSYQGGWNASTNTPTLSSGIGTKGYYYIVTTAGTTTLNGINLWSVGDWAVFDGTAWEKVNGSSSEAFSNITLTALTGLLYGNSTSPLTVATGAQVLSGLSTALGTGVQTALGQPVTGTGGIVLANSPTLTTPALGTPSSVTLTNGTGLPISTGVSGLGTGVATSLGQIVNTTNGFVTQSGADGRYAALAGLSTQVFNVASATTSTEAVPLGQAQSNFAPISGSAVYVSSASLAASGGASLVGFSTSGVAASGSTARSLQQRGICVTDYPWNADSTGTADSTTAINNAAAYLGSLGGGRLIFPPGVYHYTALAIPAGVDLEGSGSYCTVLMCTTTTGDTITLAGDSEARWVQFNSVAIRTSGRTVWAQGNNCRVIDCEAYKYFLFFDAQTAAGGEVIFPHLVSISANTTATAAGSAFAVFTNYGNALADKCSVTGPNTGTQPSYGIRLINGDTCILSNNNITHHGAALALDPATGQNIYATKSSNCLYDSPTGASGVQAINVGNVYDTTFTGDWFGLATTGNEGVLLNPGVGGSVDGMVFANCQFANNADSGLRVNGTGVTNWAVEGGYASGGTYGVNISGGSTHFRVIGVRCGNVAGRGTNSQYGVIVQAGASDYYYIAYNDLSGNGVGGLSDSGTGTNKATTPNFV